MFISKQDVHLYHQNNKNMAHLIFILAFAVYAVLLLPRVIKSTKPDFKHFKNLN